MKEKILNLAFKAFFGKTMDEIEEDSRKRNAHARLREARQLCESRGIFITSSNLLDFVHEPAVHNYLHQLGYGHAVYDIPPMINELHYATGYMEGRQ